MLISTRLIVPSGAGTTPISYQISPLYSAWITTIIMHGWSTPLTKKALEYFTQCKTTPQGWDFWIHHVTTSLSPWRPAQIGHWQASTISDSRSTPHRTGHRLRSGFRSGHQPPRALIFHGCKRVTPPRPQEYLPTFAFCHDLPWAVPHSSGGLEPSPKHHHQRRSISWLSPYNQLASRRPDPEDWQWQFSLDHVMTHCATGRWRPPP